MNKPTLDPRARPGSVEFWAGYSPDAIALREGTRSLSYAQWNEAADRLAEVLHAQGKVGSGDRVAVCMHNRLEWFVTQAAIAKLDAALVPISYRLTPSEVHYIVADCQARAFLFDHEDADAMARVWTDEPKTDVPSQVNVVLSVMRTSRRDVHSLVHVTDAGDALARFASSPPRSIVYTSGTTGRPRGVVMQGASKTDPSRDAAPAAAPASSAAKPASRGPWQIRTAEGTPFARNLLGAPLTHAAGQASARASHVLGGTVYIMPRFDAEEALRLIAREKITMSFLVPTMLNRIMSLPEEVRAACDVSAIQLITTGASPCPFALKEKVIGYFGAHCLQESYGSTEVGIIARIFPADQLRKPGSCGKPLEGVIVRLLDSEGREVPQGEVGEVLVKTPRMIEHYLNEGTPADLRDGFFATGDVGRFDDEGFLYIVDRKKDMIIAGGVNIYPAEIEAVLRKHPAVLDVAAYGVPHPDLGEQVHATVELVDLASVTEAELLAFAASDLAGYKRPRAIDFVRELPRNPAGKILKAELRAPHWQGTGTRI